MILKKGNILLRAIEEEDMEFCRKMMNSAYIESNSIGKNLPISKRMQLEWFEGKQSNNEIRFMIENINGLIGMVTASDIDWINRNCEVSIKLGEINLLEKNDTLVVSELFLEYMFNEMNMQVLYAYVLEENLLSQKLLITNGFSKDGVLRNKIYKKGKYHDVFVFSLLEKEYREKNK